MPVKMALRTPTSAAPLKQGKRFLTTPMPKPLRTPTSAAPLKLLLHVVQVGSDAGPLRTPTSAAPLKQNPRHHRER